ncbi:low-density lipoprotein receptor-related protein 4-like [Haliotis asinina]|uniref:low-density lipoprotein receptor-related protein 4-like n=1 Tax=Haliotis asinina TaxID=109174 RepID=UPI0035326A18
MTDLLHWMQWVFLLSVFLLQVSESRVCREGAEFECDDQCVPNHWRCDHDKDCVDGSDEINCSDKTCPPEYVYCASHNACISADWWCDGERDCDDGSDEHNCDNVTCPAPTTSCASGSKKCVLRRSLCDGQRDCTDGSDEEECGKTCGPDHVMCRNDANTCIKVTWLCDGEFDCPNGTDEVNCRPTCASDEVQCADDKCIKKVWLCDGDTDCSDGSDEASCAPVNCANSEFKCFDNTCIPKTWTCDGEADCEDDSDEMGCPGKSNDTVVPEVKSDTTSDPSRTSTESTLNSISTSQTSTSPTSTPMQHSTITTPATSSAGQQGACLPGRFRCGGGKCIPIRWRCDNQQDCLDNSDEMDCGDTTCGPRYVQCGSGQCIPSPWMCDGQVDCDDGADEAGCPAANSTSSTGRSITSAKTASTAKATVTSAPSSTSKTTVFKTPTSTTASTLPTVKTPAVTATRSDNDPLLLVFAHQDLRVFDLTSYDVTVIPLAVEGLDPNPLGLTVDVRKKRLYWTDVRYNTINSATLTRNKTLTNIKQLYNIGIRRAVGIALDWVHNNLYWSDMSAGTITVASLDTGVTTTLLDDDLVDVQGLDVDPFNRSLFWGCAGRRPRIEMSGTDGSNRRVILDKGLQYPKDVTIDFRTNQLYWADSGNSKIGVCDIVKGGCRVLWRSRTRLMYSAIDIYKKRLYWSETAYGQIQRINRELGKFVRRVQRDLISPKGLAVMHGVRQPYAPNRCGSDNGGCQICLPSPKGENSTSQYICACPDNLFLQWDKKTCSKTDPSKSSRCVEGYVLKGNRCMDEDECVVSVELCSQKCVNTVGSFRCTCYDGYTLVNGTECKEEGENEVFLLLVDSLNLKRINVTTFDYVNMTKPKCFEIGRPVSLDFDVGRHKVFWSDVHTKSISMASIDKSTLDSREVLVSNVSVAAGVAYDWVHQALYWTQEAEDQEAIRVVSLRSKLVATLVSRNLGKPRAIAVDPARGWMYWTNWGQPASIEKCGMDGSSRHAIVTDDIRYPNGITIDYVDKRLYWVDSHYDSVTSSDLDGNDVRVIIDKSSFSREHMFAVTVFQNNLYWTDWLTQTVRQMDKRTGNMTFHHVGGINLMDIKVFHKSRQITAKNRCGLDNRGCQICLPHPQKAGSTKEYTCACADGMTMEEDGKSCVKKDQRSAKCSSGFRSVNGTCVDDDECEKAPCSHSCTNTPGSYKCTCPDGYALINDTSCMARGPTTPSPCFEGYVLKGNRCVDEDECVVSPGMCSQKCVNTVGSFRCACYDGYTLVNGRRCKLEDENEVFFVLLDSLNIKRINLTTFDYVVMRKPISFRISRPVSLDFDIREHKVFWSDVPKGTITMARIDKSHLECPEVLVSNVTSVAGLAYDWVYQALYWTEAREGDGKAIRVMSLRTKLTSTLISTNLGNPRAIAVDPARGWMYWTNWDRPASIEKCGMDGTRRHSIVTDNIHWPNGITIDYIDKRLYWVDGYLDSVASSDLDGNDVRVIIDKRRLPREHMFAITVFENNLYWTDWLTKTVRQMDKRTGNMTFHHVGGTHPMDIKVFHKSRQIAAKNRCGLDNRGCQICLPHPQKAGSTKEYTCTCADGMTLKADGKTCVKKGQRSAKCSLGFRSVNGTCVDDDECKTAPCSHNCTNTPGSYKCTCPDGYALINDTSCMTREPVTAILLVVDRKNLKKVNLVNGKVTSIPLADESSQSRPTAIDYSFKNHTIYWTDYRETGIYRAQLKGDTLKNKRKLFWKGIRDPQGIALDWVHSNLYWSDLSAHSLHVASLDTMVQKTLVDTDLEYIRGLAVDPRHGWLYWAAWGQRPQIARSGMDGSSREVLIHRGLDTPNDVAIDYVSDRLYWVDGWATKLVSCDLNGKDCTILWKSKDRLMIFSLDAIGNSIYWTEWKEPKIQDFDLVWMERGPGVSNGTQPSGVAIIHPDRQPYARYRCTDAFSNGCQICLPTPPGSEQNFRCACPDGLYLQTDGKSCGATDPSWPQCLQGYRLVNGTCHDVNECEEQPHACNHICTNTNGSFQCACRVGFDLENGTCVLSRDAFLILIDHVRFRRFNLTTYDSTLMRVANRFVVHRPIALDFDVHNAVIYWSDVARQIISMATVDGLKMTNPRVVVDEDASTVYGLAYDWVHKNLYWVDALPDSEAVRVRSLRRMTTKTIVDRELGKPRAITVYPSKGWVFWTNWALSATIERCGMDGTNRKVLINDAIKWPNGITLDYDTERLYWTDAGLEMLSSSDIDGSNRRILLHNIGVPREHLFSVSLYGDWVYWTDWINRALKRANKHTGQNITSYRVNTSPMDVKIFHSSRQKPDIDICGNNNGGCSHLCLPTPVMTSESRGFRCECPDDMLLNRNDKSCVRIDS